MTSNVIVVKVVEVLPNASVPVPLIVIKIVSPTLNGSRGFVSTWATPLSSYAVYVNSYIKV